jgi:hypothetical protein
VFSSGCHSFWRNDFFQPLYEAHSGVILLGAMRGIPKDGQSIEEQRKYLEYLRKLRDEQYLKKPLGEL